MNNPLPFLKPVESILSLSPEYQCLHDGFDSVSFPPRTLEEARFLTHYVIRQNSYAGTHILDHLLRHPPGKSAHLAPLMLYRHVLDLSDSIGTLLRFGSATTASILVRSLFESSLGLEFMLQDSRFHEDRASFYKAFCQIGRWKNFIRYDPSTEEGVELHRILDADQKLKKAAFPRKDLSKERAAVQAVLNSTAYKPFWDKYQKAAKKPKHWYSLHSGIADLRILARAVGREAEYVLLYKMLSEVTHASDVFSGVLQRSVGRGINVHEVRGPVEKIKEVTSLAANFLMW